MFELVALVSAGALIGLVILACLDSSLRKYAIGGGVLVACSYGALLYGDQMGRDYEHQIMATHEATAVAQATAEEKALANLRIADAAASKKSDPCPQPFATPPAKPVAHPRPKPKPKPAPKPAAAPTPAPASRPLIIWRFIDRS